ncbi:flagellar export chaperone FliS [Sporanaerobium hydrogeniformans]|uniref:Flagellar export chaperone FliS n=1 Tax=Sporanaerobium hydrogeniformans TaxID=3072179 RepID=A0AC61DF80_9FIRM|nr:flagellar export chaperone FliS [Sporanaerobium hydrogeniformans]PHV71361.1 flagellar export chaperone FliS [Sporanaerobium hydrogeniformans]
MRNPYQQYKQNSVLTAPAGELTLMLYNGALKFCTQAEEAIEKQDPKLSHIYLIKVQDIISELTITLDNKYPIAAEMKRLYDYINELLIEANMKKDVQKLREAKGLIKEFRDTWQEVIKAKK